MRFTDDDLKALKCSKFSDCDWVMDWNKLKALINRLEMAERVCSELVFCKEEKFISDELNDYLKCWQKSKVKP